MNETLTFSQALDLLKNGRYVQRQGWNGKGMYLFKVGTAAISRIWDSRINKEIESFVALKTADGKVVPWAASQTDILAEDWQEVL